MDRAVAAAPTGHDGSVRAGSQGLTLAKEGCAREEMLGSSGRARAPQLSYHGMSQLSRGRKSQE